MENIDTGTNKIKQPEPDVSGGKRVQRVIKNPYVGIISDINPSSTPVSDTLVIKGQEIPKSKYQIINDKAGLINFDNLASGGIIACGILALFSLFKKK